MKIKMILITTVVSAGIIGGIGYGVYYAMKGQEQPVDVVPVTNVNQTYYGDGEGTMYGTVTSQVAQTVSLNEEYEIEKIYVEQGDTVKEGDPLFSYDMTLPELELEMEELSLQTLELDKTRLEKELEKLKRTPATASLSLNASTMTASGEGIALVEEDPGSDGTDNGGRNAGAAEAADEGGAADALVDEMIDVGENSSPSSDSSAQGGQSGSQDQGELTLDGIEEVTDPGLEEATPSGEYAAGEGEITGGTEDEEETTGETENEEETASEAVDEEKETMSEALDRYALLLLTLDQLNRDYGDSIEASDIAGPVKKTVEFYQEQLSDGTGTYQVKDSIRQLFGDEKFQETESYVKSMVTYQAMYIGLLAQESHKLIVNRGENSVSADTLTMITEAVNCYRQWFAKEQGDGTYLLLDSVREILGEERASRLEAQYVTLLIDGLDAALNDLQAKAEQARAEYEKLNQQAQAEVGQDSVEKLEQVEELLQGETETEPTSETESATETQSGTEPGSGTQPGTEPGGETQPGTEPGSETQPVTEPDTEPESESPEDIKAYIEQFLTLAASIETDENYLENWRTAINIFQQVLGELDSEVAGNEANTMDQYRLKQSLLEDPQYFTEGLEELYHSVCVKYVNGMISLVDPMSLDPSRPETYEEAYAAYEAAKAAYEELGDSWASEILEAYILDACDTILLIQAIDEDLSKPEIIAAILDARDAYAALSDEGKQFVWNYDRLEQLMKKYGIEFETEPQTESESESESEPWDDWGDYGDYGDGDGYTAEELKEMIAEKEDELKECELDIREQKLTVSQKQRIVDGKIVKSTLNGTVVSIGSEDGTSDDDYFLRVASAEGLYAKGSMNELSLAEIHVGDTISGMVSETGASFTAVIKEISDYPDPNGSSNSYGSENTNASYYQFLALIDDPEGIDEGDAELQLSETLQDYSDKIYLEKFFVRKENDGRSYVMKQGEDGLLTKQYVTTGQTIYNYAIEIVSGVTMEDKLAFPYGNDVVEGAKTEEVDQLEYE